MTDLAVAKAGAPAPATPPEAKTPETKPAEAKTADGKEKDKPAATVVVEDKKRLSQSLIWKLQRAFYASAGPLAWKPSGVPFYITSNPHIARCYARVFAGALRDLASTLDPKEPVYIFELAAGSGQFSYLFLKALTQMKAELPAIKDIPLKHVMTDFADSNLAAWQKHKRLAELTEAGVLDFAKFDYERDHELRLLRAQHKLDKGSCRNPVFVIANYAFDTTVQDAFFVKDGVLHEAATSVMSTQEEKDPNDPAVLARATLKFEPRPLKAPYYDDEALNRVLERYSRRLNNTCFLMPIGALNAIRTLRDFADGRIFLMSGDKAFQFEEELLSRDGAGLTFHGGSVSMTVNFHALSAYFEEGGGKAWQSQGRHDRLHVCGLSSGLPDLPEARLAFGETMNGFGPAPYVRLIQDLRKEWKEPTLEGVLALLRLGNWDHEILLGFRETLKKHLPNATDAMKLEMVTALKQVWDRYYPLQHDLAFDLAGFCLMMKEARDALFYCRESLRLYGDHYLTHFRAGLALGVMGEMQQAVEAMDKALALKPDHVSAREMRIRYEARLRA
jgi:tetratricopeptide (TPR) repeat protein